MIHTVDNMLPRNKLNYLLKMMPDLPWYYSPDCQYDNDGFPWFTHIFFDDFRPQSEYYNAVIDIFKGTFPFLAINRLTANLYPPHTIQKIMPYHVDVIDSKGEPYPFNVCVFSLTTNNGFTEIKTETGKVERFQSIENRGIFYRNTYYHRGSNCTDRDERIVFNLVYA